MKMSKRLAAMAVVIALTVMCGWAALADGEALKPYTSIKLNKTTLTISPLNVTGKLTVTNAKEGYEKVVWSVSPESVAEIDPDSGVITPKVDNGTAVITATGSISGKSAKCALVVRTIALQSIKLNAKNLVVNPGRMYTFKAVLSPSNVTYKGLAWSLDSANPPVKPSDQSTFDPNTGVFTAGNVEGEVLTLTATGYGGKKTACRIEVRNIPVASVKFKKNAGSLAIRATADLSKYLVVSPARAGDPSVTWTSGDENIAKVDADGKVVAVGDGKVKITATSNDNPAKKDVFTVTGKSVRVTKVSLGQSNAVGDVGDTLTLSAKVSPSNATFNEVVWTSSNEAVATVDEHGKVKILSVGKAAITASSDRGRASAKLTLRVRGGTMKTVKISAVGDVVLGGDKRKRPLDKVDGQSSYQRFMNSMKTFGGGDMNYFLKDVRHVFAGDDLSVVNLEGTLTNSSSHQNKSYAFQAPPSYVSILQNASIEAACLSNNHAFDFYSGGYTSTKRALSGAGITSYGTGSGRSAVKTVNGVKVGMMGYDMPVDRSDMTKGIRALRQRGCDIVIVSFHWTHSVQGSAKVTSAERSLSRAAINAGATLVLGHHKHVVSGLEMYKGKMIVYDLGNFLATVVPFSEYKHTMIYQQSYNVFDDGFVENAGFNIVPCLNSDALGEQANDGHVYVADRSTGQGILDRVKKRTSQKELWPLIDASKY